jgi:8-oxo-dGTP diphosphatase
MNTPTEYVLGFLFDKKKQQVILIKKTEPNWQKNLLNGIGGKIEPNETPVDAMVREFKEETDIITSYQDWKYYAQLTSNHFNVWVFKAFIDTPAPKFVTEEEPIIVSVKPSFTAAISQHRYVSNIPWLVEMALDGNEEVQFLATVKY